MSKPFLTKKEQETILSAYSKNFESEFKKVGSYTFGTSYTYNISMCPEVNREGKETGRILVNHYSFSDINSFSRNNSPFFIDVWERKDKELVFISRNLPKSDILSAEERIRVLEEEISILRGMDQIETRIWTVPKKNIRGFAEKLAKEVELYMNEYNRVLNRLHSYQEEADTYFRETSTYIDLIAQRDQALFDKEAAEKKIDGLEKRLREVTSQLLSQSQTISEYNETSNPVPHNARGAGRKKDPERDQRIERVKRLLGEGRDRDEIMAEMGIGRSTFYRYVREIEG